MNGAGDRIRAPAASICAAMMAAAALAGVIASFGQAPASSPVAALVGFGSIFAILLETRRPRHAALVGWAAGVGYFLATLSWIGEAFAFGPAEVAWMRPLAVALMPAGLALFWAVPAWALARAGTNGSPAQRALLAASLFGLAEYARGVLLTGFPWGLAAYAWIDTPAAQMAAWIGANGLTFLSFVASALAGAAVVQRVRARRGGGLALASAATIAGMLGLGALRDMSPTEDAGYAVRLVQPNVPQDEKWDPERHLEQFGDLLELTRAPREISSPFAFVIWPETATPYLVDRERAVRVAAVAAAPDGARVLLGAIRYAGEGDAAGDEVRAGQLELGEVGRYPRNSLLVIDGDGDVEAIYDKHRLVPFGEYLPLQGVLEALGLRQLAGGVGGFTPGPGRETLQLSGAPSIAPLICYEAVFPAAIPRGDQRPDLLVHITNDAWFGDSAGPRQHLVQARFRAIEFGLPLVRSANTGVSAVITPHGIVTHSLELNQRGVVDANLMRPVDPTTYAGVGESLFFILLIFGFLSFFVPTSANAHPAGAGED